MRRLDIYALAEQSRGGAGRRHHGGARGLCRRASTPGSAGQRRGAGARRAGVLPVLQRDRPLAAGRQHRGDEADGRADVGPSVQPRCCAPGWRCRCRTRPAAPTSCPTRPARASPPCRNMPRCSRHRARDCAWRARRRPTRCRRCAARPWPAPRTPGPPPRPARPPAARCWPTTRIWASPRPTIWYLARLELATGGVIGGTIPGMPVMLAGRSGRLGWGAHLRLCRRSGRVHRRAEPRQPRRVRDARRVASRFETRPSIIRVKDGAAGHHHPALDGERPGAARQPLSIWPRSPRPAMSPRSAGPLLSPRRHLDDGGHAR